MASIVACVKTDPIEHWCCKAVFHFLGTVCSGDQPIATLEDGIPGGLFCECVTWLDSMTNNFYYIIQPGIGDVGDSVPSHCQKLNDHKPLKQKLTMITL